MELINLTDHLIILVGIDGALKEYPSRGVATSKTELRSVTTIDGIEIVATKYAPVLGVPEPSVDGDIIYIVDEQTADSLRDTRTDIAIPFEPTEAAHTYLRLKLI